MTFDIDNDVINFDSIIQHLPDLVYWKDVNFIYQGCNENVANILGYETSSEIIGKTDVDLAQKFNWNENRLKKLYDDDNLIIKQGINLLQEDHILVHNTTRIYLTNKKPLYKDNKIIGILGISTDVTDRKKMEEDLRITKERNEVYLYGIIENLPQLVYWKDTNFIYQGCNKFCAEILNLNDPEEIVGKSDNDFGWSKERIEELHIVDREILQNTTNCIVVEDPIPVGDATRFFLTSKSPLIDKNGNVVGVLGISTDITDKKEMERNLRAAKETAESALEAMQQAEIEKQTHREKAEHLAIENATHKAELEAQANFIRTIDQVAHDVDSPLGSLKTLTEYLGGLEEVSTIDGYRIALMTEHERLKNTLYLEKNDTGLNFEILGSDDMLQQGHLSWEHLLKKLKNDFPSDSSDIAKFQKECLAALLDILVEKGFIKAEINEKRIPEEYRIDMRAAVEKISDIVSELLARYRPQDPNSDNLNEPKQLVLMSTILSELIGEKRMLYRSKGIEVASDFTLESQFAFVNIQRTQVNRAISNIMNNASQAFDGKHGTVTLKLKSDKEFVYVLIQDNGKGMPPVMVDKIMNKVAFTEGKKNGHGIGLGQVRDTLERNYAKMNIESELGKGTQFTLAFSKKLPPAWSIDRIQITPHDTVLILDDDKSIHGAWDLRFKSITKQYPTLKIHHFFSGEELLKFLITLSEENKKNLFLLTDFELLNQKETGVSVIEQSKIKRAILVTSHYTKPEIQEKVIMLGAKLLPKKLAGQIPIVIQEILTKEAATKKVDLIWLDDDVSFAQSITRSVFTDCDVDYFSNPNELKEKLSLYPKDTLILLDNNYEPPFSTIKGIDLAQEFHAQGFTKLFLITGERFAEGAIPDYITVIAKSDLPEIKKILGME